MPARARPVTKRSATPATSPSAANANAAFASAPRSEAAANTRLAAKRSARPVTASPMVPKMNPAWTAMVSVPTSDCESVQARARSSNAALALNQREVPSSCATTTMASRDDVDGVTARLCHADASRLVFRPGLLVVVDLLHEGVVLVDRGVGRVLLGLHRRLAVREVGVDALLVVLEVALERLAAIVRLHGEAPRVLGLGLALGLGNVGHRGEGQGNRERKGCCYGESLHG